MRVYSLVYTLGETKKRTAWSKVCKSLRLRRLFESDAMGFTFYSRNYKGMREMTNAVATQVTDTKGRERLCKAIDDGEWSQTSLAAELGLSQPSVSAWCSGHTRPDSLYRRALKRLLKIDEDDWLTAAERRLVYGRPAKAGKKK